MKILCVIQRYHPVIGGSELLTKTFMDHLSKNHTVTVYTTTAYDIKAFWDKNAKRINDYPFSEYLIKRFDYLTPTEILHDKNLDKFSIASNYPGPFSPKMWTDLVLKKIDYDLIFVTSFPYDHIFPAYFAAKKWNIPIIVFPLIHQEFSELYLTALRLSILNNSNGIFVISDSEKELLRKYGINEKKISVFPPVFSTQRNFETDSEKFKKIFSIPKNSKIILFVGSKSYSKGITHLIDSMKLIWKNQNNVILLLLGPTTNEFDEYFQNLSKSFKEKIIDLGLVDDEIKTNAYSSCDLLVLPSKSESFGMVYLEAWFQGKPVIGCNISPVSEIIDNKKNGILVDFGDVKQLKNSILFLIDNPSLCKKFGENGMKKARSYDSLKILNDFEKKCVSTINEFRNKKH